MTDTTKISLLAMVVIVAVTVLNLAMKDDRSEETGIGKSLSRGAEKPLPAGRTSDTGNETTPVVIARQEAPIPAADRVAPAATGPGTSPEPDNWVLTLYPELARIAELENQPAGVATAGLLPMLSDSDPVVRLATLESLSDLDRQAPLGALTAALGDPESQVRVAALEALAMRRDREATVSVEPLVFDRDAEVRAAAIDTLAAIGDRSAVHTLAAMLGDPDPNLRRDAVGALGEIGGKQAIGYLRQLRFDPDESIRESANAILLEEAWRTD